MYRYKTINNEIVAMQKIENDNILVSFAKNLLPYDNLEWQETEREIISNNGNLVFADSVNYAQIALASVKESKILELKLARDAEELSPVSYGGYQWDFDDKAQQRINGAIIALADGGSLTWTSADNREINGVNADDLKNVIKAAAVRSNMVHVKYRELKAQVATCSNAEQVEGIVW